ncbi:hypothetical protein [Arthrobacter sp. Leaf337]|uniref:hypothetical protein n=1 Tax=Arthrobacter sp. Leaf337 TaxID=1736342 RepID=UPI0012E2268A|nr:hypothetical protein [Arthrobacter sp. Leaf337]
MDLVKFHANLVLRKQAVGSEIDQAFFFYLKLLELSGDLCVDVTNTALFVGECLIDPIVDICQECVGQIE